MTKHSAQADTLIVLDFETTGLSPNMGDRAIEIGAVKLINGEISDHFQELMNPGCKISHFIESYTGISNDMLQDARPCKKVMQDFADFIGDDHLLAHNASFDKRFLDAEFNRLPATYSGKFTCSLLIARRLYQDAPNHKLETLIQYKNIPSDGHFHRALYDAEMTAKLWQTMLADIKERYHLQTLTFDTIQKISKTPKKSVHAFLHTLSDQASLTYS